jgi:hypothetical protein
MLAMQKWTASTAPMGEQMDADRRAGWIREAAARRRSRENFERGRRLRKRWGQRARLESRAEPEFRRKLIASCLVGYAQGSIGGVFGSRLGGSGRLLRSSDGELKSAVPSRVQTEAHRELPCWLRPRQHRRRLRIETWTIRQAGCADRMVYCRTVPREVQMGAHRELACWLRPRQHRRLFDRAG